MVRDPDTGKMMVVWAAPQETYYGVPDSCNFSRFLSNVIELEETLGHVKAGRREQMRSLVRPIRATG